MARIGLFTGVYFNNIGNAFIDFGAEETIKSAISSQDSIVKVSQCPFFASSMNRSFALKESKILHWLWVKLMSKYASRLQDRAYATISSKQVFNLLDIAVLDYLIIPGCVLTVPFIKIFGDVVLRCARRGIRVIYLGASGNFYTEYEINYVKKYLEQLKPLALMSRDYKTYKLYKDYASMSYNGIDNVFFVNKMNLTLTPTTLSPYIVLNFDEPKHEYIKKELESKFKGENIIYTNHKPYPYSNIKKLQALDSFFSALFAILLILSMICIFIEVRMEKRNKIYTVAILLTSLCLGAYGFYLLLQTIQPYLI